MEDKIKEVKESKRKGNEAQGNHGHITEVKETEVQVK